MSKIIEIRDLVYQYTVEDEAPHTAIDHLDLEIEAGSFVAVLGHNGSGKSTLAKLLNGILKPTSGQVLVDGMDTANEDQLLAIRRTVGMVFQNPDNQLVANVVEDDVDFGPENTGVPSAEIRQRVDEALRAVGMYEFREHAPHLLSGGQKQRVAIAGILAMRPKCIVLDEPTAMLDPKGRREVMNTVRTLNREYGITVVLITHYMDEAAQCDRVVVMDNGAILFDDTPKAVFSHVHELRRVGLDVPQVTQLIQELSEAGIPGLPNDIIYEEECIRLLAELLPKASS